MESEMAKDRCFGPMVITIKEDIVREKHTDLESIILLVASSTKDSLETTNLCWVNEFQQTNHKYMKAPSLNTNSKVTVNSLSRENSLTKDFSRITRWRVRDMFDMKMVASILVCLRKGRSTELVCGKKMRKDTKESGLKVRSMEMVYLLIQMARNIDANSTVGISYLFIDFISVI